ncbi:MAG: 50S ribosomal protein L11 methyltransferase [Saprospiraceae bacterium]|nr:50S ribosomal protein L11 methyltransferase [Saprospiraceae bacterium]
MSNNYMICRIHGFDEGLLALLSDAGFESFEEEDNLLSGYIPAAILDKTRKKEIEETIRGFGLKYEWEALAAQNWNALWESNFEPVVVEEICRIRAEFHPSDPSVPYEIVIQPKMAFGTGHHQTTYMMLKMMSKIPFVDKQVFDYGCGTGILAIFASMLGASSIVAIDIEEESHHNTLENAIINQITNITARQSTLEETAEHGFDIVLANINRNVLLQSADGLANIIKHHGVLLVSGILLEDEEAIVSAFGHSGFIPIDATKRDNWVCLQFEKSF